MEGGRHVQTEAVREVVREAHEAREEHGREDARPQPQRPRDRRGARQVAIDRDQGGGGAPLRHRAALALRRARARGPVGGLPQALGVAEVLQRLLAQEGLRLLEEAQGVLQRQEGAGGGRRRALGEQVRDRRDRGGRRRQARGHQGRPRARALPAADSGGDPRAQRLHRLQVGGRLRRHDEHGAQAQGRLQAEVAPGPGRATSHSARRSHASFLALGEDACAAAWEMDTVEGAGATPPGSSRSCTARAASSWPCRCRTARAPRSWRRSPPCAGSSARTARGAPSAPCSPTTGASSPTRAPSRR